ncbi:hypothetical protein [uncultured Williamsia sp.]|uniref:hypothetical protein n=1 Tax=uncultured Williamsia sp. TaxID=259311 RepID=UPI00261E4297|nr:hypothetical protein [uncultured Williamsia sp.]
MNVNRAPAITRPPHPAENLPTRDESRPAAQTPGSQPATPVTPGEERLTAQHNVRIRPSTKDRLGRGVDKLRYDSGDRSISIASVTDVALDEYLTRHGL